MGELDSWAPDRVSRLCFALACLACCLDSQVAEGDWVQVNAFGDTLVTLKRWFRKPGGQVS